MRRYTVVRTVSILALCLVSMPALAADPLALGTGMAAADVKMKDVTGEGISISDTRGEKGTLVIFTCNACPWVKAWEERIVSVGNAARSQGVGVIAINANDPNKVAEDSYEVMQKRARERGMEFPYVVDSTSDVARAYGATRTPEVFLFDAEDRLAYHGAIDDNAKDASAVEQDYLKDAVQAVAAGKPVPVAETKALGCTIKFKE